MRSVVGSYTGQRSWGTGTEGVKVAPSQYCCGSCLWCPVLLVLLVLVLLVLVPLLLLWTIPVPAAATVVAQCSSRISEVPNTSACEWGQG